MRASVAKALQAEGVCVQAVESVSEAVDLVHLRPSGFAVVVLSPTGGAACWESVRVLQDECGFTGGIILYCEEISAQARVLLADRVDLHVLPSSPVSDLSASIRLCASLRETSVTVSRVPPWRARPA